MRTAGGRNLSNRYDSSFPGSFFATRELNVLFPDDFADLDKFWTLIGDEQALDVNDDQTPNRLRERTATDTLYFRGQSNQGHGLSSSLHRLVGRESDQVITEELLGHTESAILGEASTHGLSKNVSPGEVLMILQHHQAPTRLLDVSLKPLEAMYFAVERNDSVDGRLFVLWLNDQPKIQLADRPDLPWTDFVRGGGKSAGQWTTSVRLVDEKPLDPRMIAQQGRFLVGGVQRAYESMNIWFDKQLRVSERQAISMFSIAFFYQSQNENAGTRWPALGWTIRIPKKWKAELRSRLAALGIDHSSMYPDLSSIEWRAERAGQQYLSTLG